MIIDIAPQAIPSVIYVAVHAAAGIAV